jgi:hypothetical protein
VLDSFDDASHRLVGDTEIACYAAQSLTLGPSGHFRSALQRDERSFRRRCIPANPRSPPCVEESLGIQEGNQRQLDNVYLAEPIPVAFARS